MKTKLVIPNLSAITNTAQQLLISPAHLIVAGGEMGLVTTVAGNSELDPNFAEGNMLSTHLDLQGKLP